MIFKAVLCSSLSTNQKFGSARLVACWKHAATVNATHAAP
jgi:hypothetical protein